MALSAVEVQSHSSIVKTVSAFRWEDIERAVCEKMKLPLSSFRNIEQDPNKPRKDFWSVCLDTVLQDQVENGGTATLYGGTQGLAFDSFKEESPEWSHPFFDSLESVFTEIDPQTDGFLVYFEW